MELVGEQQKQDAKTSKKDGCCHHWIILSGNCHRKTSDGVCCLCGASRRFYNFIQLTHSEFMHRQARQALKRKQVKRTVTA